MSAPDNIDRFVRAIAAIDAANAGDPETIVVAGVVRPKELAHAELATKWVRHFDPAADEAQLLAARAHHLRRWTSPRSDFPDGRKGYLRWRAALKRMHGELLAGILTEVGYDKVAIERARAIVEKRNLAADPDVQTHEDALCLVFLQTQFDSLDERIGDRDKLVDIVAKTMVKMSPRAIEAAVALEMSGSERSVLTDAASLCARRET